jgi:hypothetical protein
VTVHPAPLSIRHARGAVLMVVALVAGAAQIASAPSPLVRAAG